MSRASNKNVRLIFRLSPHDRSSVISKSRKAKISVSDFCRKAVTGKNITYIEGLPEILHELRKIGTNINQIATAANQGHDVAPAMTAVRIRLLQTLRVIDKVTGGDAGGGSDTD